MGEIVSVISGKGGVGKTLITANLGAALSRRGQNTLILDLNYRMDDLSYVLGLSDSTAYNLNDVIDGNCKIIEALLPVEGYDKLHFLPASSARSLSSVSRTSFVKLLTMIRENFDIILLDAPTGFSEGLSYALEASDTAILVTNPDPLSVGNTKKLLSDELFSGVHKCFLLNRFDRKSLKEERTLSPEACSTRIGEPLLGIIPESEEFLFAEGGTMIVSGKRSPVMTCFDHIAGRLLGEDIPINLKKI